MTAEREPGCRYCGRTNVPGFFAREQHGDQVTAWFLCQRCNNAMYEEMMAEQRAEEEFFGDATPEEREAFLESLDQMKQ